MGGGRAEPELQNDEATERRSDGVLWWAVPTLLLLISVGCAPNAGPVFEPHQPAIVWPPAPEPARISYVGQLRTSADLKPARKPFQALGELLAGPEPPQELYGPRALLLAPDDQHLWIADPGGRCIHLMNLATREYTRIRELGDTQLFTPVDLCAGPDQTLYICDSEAAAIHRVSALDGRWIETLQTPEELLRPAAITFDATADELFVVDAAGHDVKVFNRTGKLLRTIGGRGTAPGEFNFPCGIADDGDMIWIADAGNYRVQALTRAGESVAAFGQAGDAPGDMALPKSVALDSDGHVYVVDARFENVQVYDRAGRLLLAFGEEGTGPGQFWLPAGICIDGNDRIWICDTYNRRVQVFDYLKDTLSAASEREENGE